MQKQHKPKMLQNMMMHQDKARHKAQISMLNPVAAQPQTKDLYFAKGCFWMSSFYGDELQ